MLSQKNSGSKTMKTEVLFDQVFTQRKKMGRYHPLSLKIKVLLKKEFLKNPIPSRERLEELSRVTNCDIDKLRNFFKYEKKMSVEKGLMGPLRNKHKFSEEEARIIEEEFRKNNFPDKKTRQKIAKRMNCSDRCICQWFNYRNRKMRQIQKQKQSSENSIKTEETQEKKEEETKATTTSDLPKTLPNLFPMNSIIQEKKEEPNPIYQPNKPSLAPPRCANLWGMRPQIPMEAMMFPLLQSINLTNQMCFPNQLPFGQYSFPNPYPVNRAMSYPYYPTY